jgi:hypothetical protein
VAQLYPMQVWNALDLRKQNTRLRVTAMAGVPGTRGVAGFMLELGNSRSSYRVYVSAGRMRRRRWRSGCRAPTWRCCRHAVRRVCWRCIAARRRSPAALTAAGYAFTAIKR